MHSYWFDTLPDRPGRHPVPAELQDVDTVVVGAGITGLTTALLLARSGKRVVVLEARRIGAVTTGHTTGKVSLLQGTKLSQLMRNHPEKVVQSYVEANREGQAWLLRFCQDHDIPVETREALTYAATPDERETVAAEHKAAIRVGLPTRLVSDIEVPFPTYGGVALSDQAQINPLTVLAGLLTQVEQHGGLVCEDSRVVSVSKVGRPNVRTAAGTTLRCDDVVLATGTPILDRGLYFAKLEAHRSYVLLFDGADAPPSMMLSAGLPTRSLREVIDDAGRSHLMIGGNGHLVARTMSEQQHLNELRAWAGEHFPEARETHAWSAQDYRSHDGIPYVGKLPRGFGHIYLATGYDKWGLTNGIAAALRIAGEILGQEPTWGRPMSRRITHPSAAVTAVTANLKVGFALASGLVTAELRSSKTNLPEGTGTVGRAGSDPTPIATSTTAGKTCSVVGLCTHLAGVLHWNDAEKSWDCPLHGSRFAPDGQVLQGPATRPLSRRPHADDLDPSAT